MSCSDKLVEPVEELIRRTTSTLPTDVRNALEKARDNEDGAAKNILSLILANVDTATKESKPMCQDTGALVFYVDHGPAFKPSHLKEIIEKATAQATQKNYLRPNAVDPVSGENTGNNIGIGLPYIHFHAIEEDKLVLRLMQKGGGSENVGAQYRLPDSELKAGRDLEGVRRCVIDAVYQAQGQGCAPAGCIGVGIGGDRGTSFLESKEQLFRKLDDTNPDKDLSALESRLYEELNSLGIGPMGLGGKTTTMGVKIGKRHRLPACFFVSVSYICWAFRRGVMTFQNQEVTYE